ncbi:MAG: hypothetical protein ACE5ER_09770 [Nitrospinaceae bacterium]
MNESQEGLTQEQAVLEANETSTEAKAPLEVQVKKLHEQLGSMTSQVEGFRRDLRTTKREATVLKILLYTSVIVLMVAFTYSSNSLHKIQLESFQGNIQNLQTLTQAHLTTFNKQRAKDIKRVETRINGLESQMGVATVEGEALGDIILSMNRAVAPLRDRSLAMRDQVDSLEAQSTALMVRIQEVSQPVTTTMEGATEPFLLGP